MKTLKNHLSVRRLVLYGLAIALVAVTTLAIRVPNPAHGYVNLGDSMIFALALLGGPGLAAVGGGLGSAMADLLAGYPQWIIPTFVVKGVEGLLAGLLAGRLAAKLKHLPTLLRAVLGLALAGVWMVAGYFLSATAMYGVAAALANIPADFIQAGVSIPIALALAWLLYKAGGNKFFT